MGNNGMYSVFVCGCISDTVGDVQLTLKGISRSPLGRHFLNDLLPIF